MKNLENFGKALYKLRDSKNISVDKISNITKIDKKYFEEFEKGIFHNNSETYTRLFLIEYIKCIDIDKVGSIMNQFSNIFNGKIKQKNNLKFVELEELEDNSNLRENNKDYNPKKIATIIFVFIVIIFIFQIAMNIK